MYYTNMKLRKTKRSIMIKIDRYEILQAVQPILNLDFKYITKIKQKDFIRESFISIQLESRHITIGVYYGDPAYPFKFLDTLFNCITAIESWLDKDIPVTTWQIHALNAIVNQMCSELDFYRLSFKFLELELKKKLLDKRFSVQTLNTHNYLENELNNKFEPLVEKGIRNLLIVEFNKNSPRY